MTSSEKPSRKRHRSNGRPHGRVPIRLKLGYSYKADNGKVLYCIKAINDGPFKFLCEDEDGRLHRYTEKGRYFHGIGNHPFHLREQLTQDVKELFYQMHGKSK